MKSVFLNSVCRCLLNFDKWKTSSDARINTSLSVHKALFHLFPVMENKLIVTSIILRELNMKGAKCKGSNI